MPVTQKPYNIKLFLFIIAMISIIMIFWMNRMMINKLRNEARTQVEFLAKSYSDAINSSNQEDIRFVMDILLPSMNFPILITTKDEISAGLNLGINADKSSDEYNIIAWALVEKMDQTFTPLDLVWDDVKWGEIHYSDPDVVTRLSWMPYLEIGFGIIIIWIAIWGLQIMRRSEKNLIYAGMARETAHQLGTPVSSLMGWIKLLREETNHNATILDSVEEDISQLSAISERFSKIGSKPKLNSFVLYELIEEVSLYMKHRLPKNSEINIIIYGDKSINIKGDWVLIRWALENLLKNSIDAIDSGNGEISSIISKYEDGVCLDIRDTGKGINRGDWKNIFRPGYSSKQRGWGLGLSLTQRIIVEIHGGRIGVLASKPGETIFRINFPQ